MMHIAVLNDKYHVEQNIFLSPRNFKESPDFKNQYMILILYTVTKFEV